jgi:hypothetical protein
MPRLTNSKISSASVQQVEENFDLTAERIQTAFSGSSNATYVIGNDDENTPSNFRNSFNIEMPAPRGVHFIVPKTNSISILIGFVTEQRWQGNVTSVGKGGKFGARVYDLSEEHSDEIEDVEFEMDDVPSLMQHLVKPGGIFYWNIGFEVKPSGQKVRQSILSFPMIPTITKSERAAARKRAEERFTSLGWVRDDQSPRSKDGT